MIGLASQWLATGSTPFALSSGGTAVLLLLLALLRTPFEVELRVSSILSLRLRTKPPVGADAARHRAARR